MPQLELTLSAHATNAVPDGSGNAASASGKHDIVSAKLPAAENVELFTAGDKTYAVWKPELHLIRPRARLQRPAIYFTANLAPSADVTTKAKDIKKDILTSYEALPANVLEPLRFDPALGPSGRDIYLSETRVTKVSPAAPGSLDTVRPIRGITKRAFPAVPALFVRTRYASLRDEVMASVHLETSQLIAGQIEIANVQLDLSGSKVEPINGVDWPQRTRAGDETVLLYRITRTETPGSKASGTAGTATISLRATALLEQGLRVELAVQTQTRVDMSTSRADSTYRWSRPLSASFASHRRLFSQTSTHSRSSELARLPTKEGEVIFTCTAPRTARQDSDFTIKVQCSNKSNRNRRFTLVPIQPKAPTHPVRTTSKPQTGGEGSGMMAPGSTAPPPDQVAAPTVLTLTPDVRIGPLPAGACFETEVKYRAVSAGVLELGIIRVVDLESKQTLDVAELPDVIASKYFE